MLMLAQRLSPVHITAPHLPIARVFHQIRATDADRTSLQRDLNLSQAGVTRHVAALIDAGLVEETRVDAGVKSGRPRTKLGIDARHLTAWGAHIGLRSMDLTVCDLAGRVIRYERVNHEVAQSTAAETLNFVARRLETLSLGLPAPRNVGVALSAHLSADGTVTSEDYGWSNVDIGAHLPFPATIGSGVAAMAGSEIINASLTQATQSTLYFYAREMVSHAWIFNGAVHRPNSGRTPTAFGNTNTLKDAFRRGLSPSSFSDLVQLSHTNSIAREILNERAHNLADAVTTAVDVVDPEAVVFAGEAFTLDPETLRIVVTQLRSNTGSQLRIQRADAHILRTAAIQVALHPIRQDPLAFVDS
ncbi:ROK family transcriptional regulator [Corynebacterium suranareeae]|uniref:ROK family transcriptional regulator n=1 Tax=Corynebacterium suranareeae TaxID=2506452 RepID=UPI000BBAE15A|nr:ROK family transcriptional regulator [Corynebacterium suranareeae]